MKVAIFGASGMVGLAMIRVAENGFPKPVLETRDINTLSPDRD